MAVIEEVTENGGTLFMDNIRVKVKEQGRRRDSEVANIASKRYDQKAGKEVPRSVDVLLRKQENLHKDILYSDQKAKNKPAFISGAK